jgi:4-hydroxy 2-oxovalerate aldolase
MSVKILDCTLRDGGYYTNWDFPRELVDKYIEAMSDLPVEYIEVGYRSPAKTEYLGEYFYTPIETIDRIRENLDSSKKIAIMINTKDIASVHEVEELMLDCKGKIDLVRFAVAPINVESAILLAQKVKQMGFEVALNLMYLSQRDSEEIISEVDYILEHIPNIDYIYLVDSYGACYPSEVKEKFIKIRNEYKELAFGFHGHDNIQLAYANSLEAISTGVNIIDSTITGMGRGAGNLSTEVICSFKAANENIDLDYTNLVEIVEIFDDLKAEYGWGTSLPYIISGFNKLPQGEVMDLISLKRYSTNNIVRIIKNKINNGVQNYIYNDIMNLSSSINNFINYDFAILVGGGNSVTNHIEGLKTLNNKYNVLFIHSTTKHLDLFSEAVFNNLVCLPGDEVNKAKGKNFEFNTLAYIVSNGFGFKGHELNANFYSIGESSLDIMLDNNVFTEDAPLFMSLKVTKILDLNEFYLIGFDGYDEETQTNKILRVENQAIIDNYSELNSNLVSLTPSTYNINVNSLYSLVVHGNKNIKETLTTISF